MTYRVINEIINCSFYLHGISDNKNVVGNIFFDSSALIFKKRFKSGNYVFCYLRKVYFLEFSMCFSVCNSEYSRISFTRALSLFASFTIISQSPFLWISSFPKSFILSPDPVSPDTYQSTSDRRCQVINIYH